MPWIIVIACIITKVDAPYYILSKIITNNTSCFLLLVSHFLRLFMLCVVSLEALRTPSYIICLSFFALIRIETVIYCLLRFRTRPARFRFYANIVNLEFGRSQWYIDGITYVTFTSFFWIAVGLIWVVVKRSPSEISYCLYAAYFGMSVSICVILLFTLPKLCGIVDTYEMAIKKNIQIARRFNVIFKVRRSRLLLKQVICIRAAQVCCGPYGKLSKEFSNKYFSDIILRCFDVILLFDARY